MPKQYSKYFKAKILDLTIEPRKHLERISFFHSVERIKDEYFMLCSLLGPQDNFRLRVKIEKEEYEKSKVDDEVSIHLNFSYDFTCFTNIKREENKPQILEVEKSF